MTHSPQDPVDLTDPAISPHRLQELAQSHPESWDDILAHPNVYPGLAGWIRDRQAEQTAAQAVTAQTQEPAADDDATKVFEPAEAAEAQTSTLEPADGEADGPEPDPVNDEAEVDVTETIADHPRSDDPAATDQAEDAATPEESDQPHQPWAMPDPTAQAHAADATSSDAEESAATMPMPDAAQQDAASGQAQHGEPIWGWPGATSSSASQHSQSQQQHQAPPGGFGQQPYGYQQQQPPYGYGQQPYGQQPPYGQAYGQAFQPRPRQHTPINLNSARTWGLFVTGGAAFMTLFGFFFGPSVGGFGVPSSSHLASGGWMILLLFLATVTLSILQLLKPSAWMRFFFIAVSFGAAFMMIGRTTALLGFFTLQHTSFSVIWMLFMSLVLLAGIMIYTAPKTSDAHQAQTPGTPPTQPAPQQFGYQQPQQPPYGQQPGTPPYGGYGAQPGGYPSGPQQ